MGPIHILFGTESGNAEMVADDIAEALDRQGVEHQVASMDGYDIEELSTVDVVIVITSTYGDGELPMTTAPFHVALLARRPNLSALRFAAFGLGDSTYETYNNAIGILVETLSELGAIQIGHTGRHDASGAETYTETALSWIATTLQSADIGH